jgi:hypothetical protein
VDELHQDALVLTGNQKKLTATVKESSIFLLLMCEGALRYSYTQPLAG